MKTQHTISESLVTPVKDAGDVIVIGAGSAGVSAALSAARQGARVTLVDSAGYPGGNLVSGLYIIGGHDGEKQIVKGLYQEYVDRLREKGGVDADPAKTTGISVDPEILKIVLLEMLNEAGVELMLHTQLVAVKTEGKRVTHAIVEGKGGRLALEAKRFIDTSGDADLAHMAGFETLNGRKSDGLTQPMTLVFAAGGIDSEVFESAGGWDYLMRKFDEVTARETFLNPRKKIFSGYWTTQSRRGELMFNATRVQNLNGLNPQELSRAEVEGRLQAYEFVHRFLRKHVKGFENAYLVWTAAHIGIRETRRIVGEYTLTAEDICTFRKFEDTINCGSYPIDIHSPTDEGTEFSTAEFYGGRYWTIPYRSLLPRETENLIVAGRCLSATHEALGAVRVMANTIGMGEVAGVACVQSIKDNQGLREVSIPQLQETLLNTGSWLGDFDFLLAKNRKTTVMA